MIVSPESLELLDTYCSEQRAKIIDGDLCNPLGRVAIITPLISRHEKPEKARKELDCYMRDADQMAGHFKDLGVPLEDVRGSKFDDITAVLKDENIKGLVLIGNGNYNGIDAGRRLYDWSDVAVNSWALKEFVVQRTCGEVFPKEVNLPFGTFAVSDQSRIVAPNYGRWIPDENPGDEHFFCPYTKQSNTAEELIQRDKELHMLHESHTLQFGSLTLNLVNFLSAALKRRKE